MVEGIASTTTSIFAGSLIQKLVSTLSSHMTVYMHACMVCQGNSRYFSVLGLALSCVGYILIGLLPFAGIM